MEWRHTLWHEARLVYTATPKVANTSVKSALLQSFLPTASRRNPHHEDLPYVQVKPNAIAGSYKDYLHFAVVRDPFDRFVSFYEDSITGTGFRDRMERLGFEKGMPFRDAVKLASTIPDRCADPHMRSQSYLLLDRWGRFRPDFIVRFQRIHQDWRLLTLLAQERTGRTLGPLPHRRVSNRRDCASYYDAETRALVASRYRTDFARLGYRTGPGGPGDWEVDDAVTRAIAGALSDGARAVLDMTMPTHRRASVVESRGGHYLGVAGGSSVGQLTSPRVLKQRAIESLFDVLVVAARDTRRFSRHRRLRARFESTGRTVIST